MFRADFLTRLLVRGIAEAIRYSGGLQFVRVTARAGEVRDDIERAETWGHTSVPPSGTEVIIAYLGADPAHGVIVGEIIDGTDRPELQEGESGIYAVGGARIEAQLSGKVAIGTTATELLDRLTYALDQVAAGVSPPGTAGGQLSTAANIAAASTQIKTIMGAL